MKTSQTSPAVKGKEENKNEQIVNTIKVGTFQLQTKSFWIGLVSILVLFLLAIVWLNTYYWHNTCKELIKVIEIYNQNQNK